MYTRFLVLSLLVAFGAAWPCEWPLLKQNSISPPQVNNTKLLQLILNEKLNNNLTVNGIFDLATSSAVKQYQSSNGLPADGSVGGQTWSKLLNYIITPTATDSIKAVQIILGLRETGIFDTAFKQSVATFQAQRGVLSTGIVDLGTWHLLVSDCNSSLTTAVYGFDIGWPAGLATYEDLKCLRDAGFSFSIFEIYTEGHLLWQEGIKNILTAQRVGFPYINGYHFPKRSQDPTTQVKIVLEALQKANVTFPRVWIDIEGPTWASYTTKQNVDFVNTIRKTYEANGFKVGMYCGREYPKIFGSYTGFSDIPVWYAHYDLVPSFVDWWGQPYGGWSRPNIKQFWDKAMSTQNSCRLNIDWDWSPSPRPFL